MNDFDYENLQKKRIAYSARHMKRGSKSRKCTMPSDYMTAAQLRKKNGDVRTMNMNEAVAWVDFKQWPSDIQKEYLEYRMRDFDCTMAGLAEILGADIGQLRKCLREIGFDMSRFAAGRKMTKENRERMLSWIQVTRPNAQLKSYSHRKKAVKAECAVEEPSQPKTDNAPEDHATTVLAIPESPVARSVALRSPLMKTPFVKMDFLGTLNPTQIVNTLLALAKDCNVKVSLTLEYQEVE